METRIPHTARGTSGGRPTVVEIESFTTPGTFYEVRLYADQSGKIVGGFCNCPARVSFFADKHAALAIAESYGAKPPKVGSFTTPDFLDELSELTGIAFWELSSAFDGERKVVAKAVVKAAVAVERYGDEEDYGRFVRGWARRHARGWYRPGMHDYCSALLGEEGL